MRPLAEGIAGGSADEGLDDQRIGDRKQRGAEGQEQPPVPQGQPQPHGVPGQPAAPCHRSEPARGHYGPPIWYPDLGTVLMSGGSPSLARRRLTVIFTAAVNGSACWSHTRSSSSSADTARP